MADTLKAIDEWLLDRAQIVSDACHTWTGVDCIHQSRICRALLALFWLIVVVTTEQTRRNFDWIAAILVLGYLRSAFWEDFLDQQARQAAARGFRNPARIQWFPRFERAVIGPMIIMSAVLICLLHSAQVWCSLLLSLEGKMLFAACDVQTPKPAKILVWIRFLGMRKPKLIEVEVK